MSVTEKGITAYNTRGEIPNTLFTWLQKLVLLFPKVSTYSVSLNPSEIGTSGLTETYTVTGLNLNDIVTVNPPEMTAGLGIAYARVSAADTLQIRWTNSSGGAVNPSSGTYKILAVRL